ncbi:MAG: hypothetical protein WC682_04885 [Parcubacteria group bacterium]|jgi:hypothetical protein
MSEVMVYAGGNGVSVPDDCEPFFFAKINEEDGYLVIYGHSDGRLSDGKAAIGHEGVPMEIFKINHGHWIGAGKKRGIIEVDYKGSLMNVAFSPKEGRYNNHPFEKVIENI